MLRLRDESSEERAQGERLDKKWKPITKEEGVRAEKEKLDKKRV
jgi:hypothetical protein